MNNYQASADYLHIGTALKSLWQPFEELVAEIDSFSPRPLEDFDEERRIQFEHFKKMNPSSSDKSIEEFVNNQIAFAASEKIQFVDRFSERLMTQYVMVTFLSHSLCEAAINTILAIGLSHIGSQDLFGFFEKANIKEKWITGPKSFYPDYKFPSGTALHETLIHLTKRRNVLVHYKIQLHVNGEKIMDGSNLERQSFPETIRWVRRFFSLPYDLVAYADSQIRGLPMVILGDSTPIPITNEHQSRP